MPKQPWELPGWTERIEATGWPEWEGHGYLYKVSRLPRTGMHNAWFRYAHYKVGWRMDSWLTDHEAACLIREHWRVWLYERGVWLEPFGKSWMIARYKSDLKTIEYYLGKGKWIEGAGVGIDGYDTAQAAAVDAVLREGDSDAK